MGRPLAGRGAVQALGPVRTVTLSRRELLKTGEGGAVAVDAAPIRGDVALEDETAASSASSVPLPAPDQDPQTWLRWLASRASTLQERLDTAHMAPAGPADETAVQARLARWACRCWGPMTTGRVRPLPRARRPGFVRGPPRGGSHPVARRVRRYRVGPRRWNRRFLHRATIHCRTSATPHARSPSRRCYCLSWTSISAVCGPGHRGAAVA